MHPPVIVIASPEDGSEVEADIIRLSGVAEDDEGLEALELFVNGKLLNFPAASSGVSIGNHLNRPKGRGIKPLSASGGLKNTSFCKHLKTKGQGVIVGLYSTAGKCPAALVRVRICKNETVRSQNPRYSCSSLPGTGGGVHHPEMPQ